MRLSKIGSGKHPHSDLDFPNDIKEIGIGCFQGCMWLSELIFESGSNLKAAGDCALPKCCLQSIRIPNTVEEIIDRLLS
jgi:hypothetical protein